MRYKELCEKYLAKNEDAVNLIDTLISAGIDLNYLRDSDDKRLHWIDYNDIRQQLDEVIDSVTNDVKALGIKPPLIDYLEQLEKEDN